MTYVIAEPCVGVKDKACADVCPADCIHGEDNAAQMYINPDECIFCGSCEAACPVGAIFEDSTLPAEWQHYLDINAAYYKAQ